VGEAEKAKEVSSRKTKEEKIQEKRGGGFKWVSFPEFGE